MRLLLVFLLFCGSSLLSASIPDCNWKMPDASVSCTQKIKWKAHNNNQATATCLDYFPTTYVEGVIDQLNKAVIICTVHKQFECRHVHGSVVIFDKCYKFHHTASGLKTIPEYQASKATMCSGEGGLPVLLTMTQAKHVAKAAHKLGIIKMWANLDKDGKTIDKTYSLGEKDGTAEGFLLYRDPWKVHHESHWAGEKLVKTPKKGDEFVLPAEAKYLFFRTNTDYVNSMWQGSFEHATDATKASVVCEYQAKTVPDQEKYCGKIQKLGLKAKYNSHRNKRCVYTTLSTYPLEGTTTALQTFTGCNEKPSVDHSSGLDDGTAGAVVYTELTSARSYRTGTYRLESSISEKGSVGYDFRVHCDKSTSQISQRDRIGHRLPYQMYSHYLKDEFSSLLTIVWENNPLTLSSLTVDWENEYPKDECSDFPGRKMYSNTLAIRKGKIIDVPTPVRLPALCSIVTNIDCKLYEDKANNKNVCGGDGPARYDMKCEDVEDWNPITKHYATCSCLEHHNANGDQCDWSRSSDECGAVLGFDDLGDNLLPWEGMTKNSYKVFARRGLAKYYIPIRVVVRKGCTLWIYSHNEQMTSEPDVAVLENLTVGDYEIPQQYIGSASTTATKYRCTCPF